MVQKVKQNMKRTFTFRMKGENRKVGGESVYCIDLLYLFIHHLHRNRLRQNHYHLLIRTSYRTIST
jgi:hypothetical protein